MAYFRQTDSLEDLKNQYRILLTKFDYKDPKNAKLLAAIDKEYKKCQAYAKMAPLRKAKDDFVRKMDEEERQRVLEQQKKAEYNEQIKRRTQAHYTKADCHNYLDEAVRELKKYAYMQVRDNIKSGSAKACRNELDVFRMNGYRKTYINLRTLGKLTKQSDLAGIVETGDNVEIALVSLANDNNKEQILHKMEEKLGAVYVNAYKEACEKYMDDVEYARVIANENKRDREDKRIEPFRKVIYMITRVMASIIFGAVAFLIVMAIFAMLTTLTGRGIVSNIITIIGVVEGIMVVVLVVKILNRLLDFDQYNEVTTKKTAYSRVTEGEKYDELEKNENISKNTSGIIRLIFRLLGIRI